MHNSLVCEKYIWIIPNSPCIQSLINFIGSLVHLKSQESKKLRPAHLVKIRLGKIILTKTVLDPVHFKFTINSVFLHLCSLEAGVADILEVSSNDSMIHEKGIIV